MSESSDAYRGCRERFTEIVTTVPVADLERRVPACPDWTVTDLLAHQVGVAHDTVTGNIEQSGADEWTAAHIAQRADLGVPDLIADWREIAVQLEQGLEQVAPGPASLLIGDIVTHEHDLRGAVGRPGARDSDAVWIGLDRYVKWFGKRLKDAGLPSVVVHGGSRTWQAGILDPAAEIDAEPFELLRALTGRRTIDEIKSLRWTGDPAPYLELFSTYPPTRTSLSEG